MKNCRHGKPTITYRALYNAHASAHYSEAWANKLFRFH